MMEWQAEFADTVCYPPLGHLVLADRRPRSVPSMGWQTVLLLPELRPVWVHPAILGRFGMECEVRSNVCEISRPLRSFQHEVQVHDMPGYIRHVSDHTGVCVSVIAAKLRGGGLLDHVLRGLEGLGSQHHVLSFRCDHGKHRSVAALTVCMALCPLARLRREGKTIRCCRAGCVRAGRDEVLEMVATYLAVDAEGAAISM